MKQPYSIFLENIIPETKQDVAEFAKLLAFESGPAAGIFLMRIFETVVDKYYFSKPELDKANNLHRKIEQLVTSLPEEKKYLTNLLMLLKNDRNNITHPSNRVEDIIKLLEIFDIIK